ncbi:EAL domain-containing protein [Telmatospirillum sp.]|uniref:EAL domain-containing protein n=1 Tax=Telmatospirillum sp. TaxID=2079197 RepID=UPI002850F9C9|nr:EAL domain-containing protein [Telmatospirillum sp.]MDR3437493.1 EAL domain-containing protein [Telmatospirillum sp.]
MTDPNARFLVHLKTLAEQPAGYRAVHLHVSPLPAAKKSRDNLSRAIRLLADVKTKYKDGEIFLMKNLDIIFLTKEIGKPVLAATGDAIQHVFLGQMSPTFTNVHGGENEFFTLFDLSRDYAKLHAWAEDAAGVARAARPDELADAKGVIDVAVLARIKEEIHRIDIAPMLFNQPVYSIGEQHKPVVMFHEIYMSIAILEDKFCPGQSLTSRKGLFTDLTEELDIVVLRILAEPADRGIRRKMSINVNIATLASPTFVKFDAELPPDARQGVVLEINKTDVFENMRLYRELVPFLRERGYRILLDGLSFYNVAAIDFAGIDCDFAKIFWSGEASSLSEDVANRIYAKLREREMPTFLLGRCDTAESIRFAKAAGIHLVQGRLVDHMVKKNIPF